MTSDELRQKFYDHLDAARIRVKDRTYDCAVEEMGAAIIILGKLLIAQRKVVAR